MSVQTMDELFLHGLKDIYFAEQQIVKALPKVAKAVDSGELEKALNHHLEETRGQVERLEKVFASLDEKPQGVECPAIEGLIEEAEELMKETKDKQVLTAGLLAGAQAVEHYEIARYGTLCEWAKLLGHDKALKLLTETLAEEKKADEKLTALAKDEVNRRAAA